MISLEQQEIQNIKNNIFPNSYGEWVSSRVLQDVLVRLAKALLFKDSFGEGYPTTLNDLIDLIEEYGGGGGESKIIWVTYGVSRYADILGYINEGKLVLCKYNNCVYAQARNINNEINFITPYPLDQNDPSSYGLLTVPSSGPWSSEIIHPFTDTELTGTPTAPTAPTGTDTNQIATTEFVNNQIESELEDIFVDTELTGTPTAPTAPTGTDTNQIATTEFVNNQIESELEDVVTNPDDVISDNIAVFNGTTGTVIKDGGTPIVWRKSSNANGIESVYGGEAPTDGAVAHGSNTTANGEGSHAEGSSTIADGDYSHAEGSSTTAGGDYSHAEGSSTIADGDYSHAEGDSTTTVGDHSHAEGDGTTTVGYYSHAEGHGFRNQSSFTINGAANTTTYTTSKNHGLRIGQVVHYNGVFRNIIRIPNSTSFIVNRTLSSTALSGVNIYICYGIAYGERSHAEGYNTIAIGAASHAEGESTIAYANSSHAEGYNTKASAYASHAEGLSTIADGDYSHAEGCNTTASYDYSHAEGDNTTASAYASHAEGYITAATNDYEHSQGVSNISNMYTLNSIGVGDPDPNTYKNAVEVMRGGNVYMKGIGGFDGDSLERVSLQKHLESLDLSQEDVCAIYGLPAPLTNDNYIAALYIDDFNDGENGDTYAQDFRYHDIYEYIAEVDDDPTNAATVGTNIFVPTANTMTYEGVDYRVWLCMNYNNVWGSSGSLVIGLTPLTLDYNTLIKNSMTTDIYNAYSPFVILLRDSDTYMDNLDYNYRLITVKQIEPVITPIPSHSPTINSILVDNFNDFGIYASLINNQYSPDQEGLRRYLGDYSDQVTSDSFGQCYVSTGNTIEYEGKTYEIWIDDTGSTLYGLLPQGTAFQDLYPHSLICNSNNIKTPYCPFIVLLNTDESETDYNPTTIKYSALIAVT